MFKSILVVFCFAVLGCFTSESNLWDLVIQMKQVETSVDYNGRYLHVWKEDKQNYSRFFVTPLCELITTSVNCTEDDYSPDERYILNLRVRLWSKLAAEATKLKLEHKGTSANINDIYPLPMQTIRLGSSKRSNFEVDFQWRSHQHQPKEVTFELHTKDKAFCEKMVIDAHTDPANFLSKTKLYFEFSMMAGKQAYRDVNITGQSLTKSEFFSKLNNDYSDKGIMDVPGIVYLNSSDMNKLSNEIFKTTIAYEELSSDYISTQEEESIIKSLMGIIEDQQLSATDLSKEAWDSVFWDDIFTRPDIQTEYYQDVFKYDEGEKRFKFDNDTAQAFYEKLIDKYGEEYAKSWSAGGSASFMGFGGSASASNSNSGSKNKDNETETHIEKKEFYSSDEIESFLKQSNVNVKWTGQKFTPKGLNLHRINTKSLLSRGEIFYKRVVTTTVPTTQKIEVQPEFVENSDSPVSPNFYEELKLLQKEDENLNARMNRSEETLAENFIQLESFLNDNTQNLLNTFNSKIDNFQTTSINEVKKLEPLIEGLKQALDTLKNQATEIQNVVNNARNEIQALQGTSNNIWNKVAERRERTLREHCNSRPDWWGTKMTDLEWMLLENMPGNVC